MFLHKCEFLFALFLVSYESAFFLLLLPLFASFYLYSRRGWISALTIFIWMLAALDILTIYHVNWPPFFVLISISGRAIAILFFVAICVAGCDDFSFVFFIIIII